MQKFFDFRRVLWGVLAGSVIIVSSCLANKIVGHSAKFEYRELPGV